VEEAQIEAQLQHPNIVPVHDIGTLADGRQYFTMKQIRGTEFSVKIKEVHAASTNDRWRNSEDGTTFRDLIRIHQTVCETVAYAHAQGVIHRDLKPENIMLGGFGEVLVVDWGLAKLLSREEAEWLPDEELLESDRSKNEAHMTQVGSVAGTPYYMAPEQASGQTHEVGIPTDVYTLGAILYEILSGLPPYYGRSAFLVLQQVKERAPSSLRVPSSLQNEPIVSEEFEPVSVPTAAKIPKRLVEICEAAMQRDISARTASAEVLANELRAWLEGDEKREKGLNEVEAARQIADRARGEERKSADEWGQADGILSSEGPESASAWELWRASQESEAESRRLWRRYIRKLQGALVHAPDLEEAHYALALQRIDELIERVALGDRAGQETRTQQLNGHLAQLPSEQRNQLIERRDEGLADVISGHRHRRGVLVGRHNQKVAILSQIKEGARLLTLLGTAGVGKTRLSLELADSLRVDFTRTIFCDLTEANDELGIVQRLSQSLQTRLRDTDPVTHLGEVLAKESTLLVLDNLEQIRDLMGPMTSSWVQSIENLQILTTSRLKLGIPEEVVVRLQPLTLLEGVDLFIRRARAANPHVNIQAEQYTDVCEIVDRLDRLPLALELAAARLNVFSIDDLSARLEERFSILRSRGRDGQALDGALDWSWDMLKPWTKAALTQASLFRGGFTLASAEGIIDLGRHKKTPEMFDILGELVDNSLLRKDQTEDGGVRYSLLESIRAYARDKLLETPGFDPDLCGKNALDDAQQRHAEHFSQLGKKSALQALDGFNSDTRWAQLFREFDNLVEGIEQGDTQSAALCCLAALKVLGMKGPVSRGVDLATHVLTLPELGRREKMLLEIERSKCLRISGRMSEARAMVAGPNRSSTSRLPLTPPTKETPDNSQ
jgi:serine/threonine protein kinase/predicted ATPase